MSVIEDAVRIATKGLDFRKPQDRLVGFYARRRAGVLLAQTPALTAAKLSVALVAERDVVAKYVDDKTRVLIGGSDPKTPPHLDLADMARIRDGTDWTTRAITFGLAARYTWSRRGWIAQIVWRAVAVHGDVLWKQLAPTPKLRTEALDEVLDRRLRVVERMACNVNTGGILNTTSGRTWKVSGPHGPWSDGVRVRLFDYPFLPEAQFKAHLTELKQQGWESNTRGMLLFKPVGPPPKRVRLPPLSVPPRAVPAWGFIRDKAGADQFWIRYLRDGPVAPTDAVDRLFKLPQTDFRKRNWFYCDFVGSTLCLEALSFGRSRRDGNTTAFDALLRRPGPDNLGYVVLGPVVDRDTGLLMADPADTVFFESIKVDVDDLQVGDHVVFWNNLVYDVVARGAWRNEFSFITGVDADPTTGSPRSSKGLQVELAGHGEDAQSHSSMAGQLVAQLVEAFQDSRKLVEASVKANPSTTVVGDLVKWSPYEDFDGPGAWWVQIGQSTWQGPWGFATAEAAVTGIPRMVTHDPAGGQGYHPPPDTTAIYFPLWEPKVPRLQLGFKGGGDSWRAYLKMRKDDATYRPPSKLAALAIDGQVAPGLFHRGAGTKVAVVRPRVRP